LARAPKAALVVARRLGARPTISKIAAANWYDIIGTDVDEDRPDLSGGDGELPDRQGVEGERALGVVLAFIDPMVGRGVED